MKVEIVDREEKFTDEEFAALERNSDGDIIDLSIAFIWLTEAQKERLTGDDWSRLDDYEEELRILIAEEIGNA